MDEDEVTAAFSRNEKMTALAARKGRLRMVLETRRLLLREMKPDDFQALFPVLSDPETMCHYPYTFDEQHVKDWIERNINRYQKDGFAVGGLPEGD